MPIYEYQCQECYQTEEKIMRVADRVDSLGSCQCGEGELKRIPSIVHNPEFVGSITKAMLRGDLKGDKLQKFNDRMKKRSDDWLNSSVGRETIAEDQYNMSQSKVLSQLNRPDLGEA